MKRNYTGSLGAPKASLLDAIKNAVNTRVFAPVASAESDSAAQSSLKNIAGMEGLDSGLAQALKSMSANQSFATASAIKNAIGNSEVTFSQNLKQEAINFAGVAGMEGFSNAQELGKSADVKAVNIALNSLSHSQTDAANEMFKPIVISDGEEQITFTVRTAGLGRYVYGASAFDSASQLRPIMSLIRSGDFFIEDTTALHPVAPADADAEENTLFVTTAQFKPWTVEYPDADARRRKSHLTNFIRVGKHVTNLLGLSEVPGQEPFNSSDDEIESNSITAVRLLMEVEIDGTKSMVSVDTSAYSNNIFGVTKNGQTSDDRELNMRVQNAPAAAFEKYDEAQDVWVADDAIAGLAVGGYTPHFRFSVTGNFWRQGYALETASGDVELAYLTDAEGNRYNRNTKVAAAKAIFKRFTSGKVVGIDLRYFHNNINRTDFGYRVELYDAQKIMGTRIQTPVSLKYPVTKEDTNQSALNDAMEWVITTIQAQTTNAAFEAARLHIEAVTRMNGSAIVGNDQGSNVMAGMHFVNATAIHRDIYLKDTVSTDTSVNLLDNVAQAFVNNITEIVGALETNSSLAAICEYRKVERKWVVVGHQNLARYVFKQGDARTLGAGVSFRTVRTNLDPMIGKFYIFPESDTTDTNIDVIGGMGILVSKEHRVFQANVTRNNADFGIMVTIPYYKHHGVCPIVGVLNVLDAKDALSDKGLLHYLTAQRIKLIDAEGKTYKASAAAAGGDTETVTPPEGDDDGETIVP